MYLYETISPEYAKMWIHSSQKEYLEARPWLISLLSLSLLKPSYLRSTLIHIPRRTCPFPNADDFQKNALISEKIESLSYTTAKFGIAQVHGGSYYEYEVTSENEYLRSEIEFTGGDPFIRIALIITVIIAVYAIFMIFINLIKYKHNLELIYMKYLNRMRKLNHSKKVNTPDPKTISLSNKQTTKVKKLEMGLLFSTIIEEDNRPPRKYARVSFLSRLYNMRSIHISLFKSFDLYLDYIIRNRTYSWFLFLESIQEDPDHFTIDKLESDDKFDEVSARVDLLIPKYLKFCTKMGVNPVPIEKQTDTLAQFQLEMTKKNIASTNAYLKVRWKTPLEKIKSMEKTGFKKSGLKSSQRHLEELSVVQRFISSELIMSNYTSDYVLVEDLVKNYSQF